MSFNGSGTYSLPGAALNDGDTVSATENNTFRNDVAGAFNKALCRDGQATPTANLPMGGFKLTGLAAGTAPGDSVRYQQVTTNVAITGGTITGITDLAVADGGTGASTASAARTNLGLGSLATLNSIANANTNFTTEALGDNTTAPATTAFVQRASGNYKDVSGISGATTLTSSSVGNLILLSSGGYTVTLPLANSLPSGSAYHFEAFTTSNVTLARSGANNIRTGATLSTSVTIEIGDTLTVITDGTAWTVSGGTVANKFSNQFASSTGASGYQKLPGGLIMAWGSATTSASADVTVNFPAGAGFSNVRNLQLTLADTGGIIPYRMSFNTLTASSFRLSAYDLTANRAAIPIYWYAIGA